MVADISAAETSGPASFKSYLFISLWLCWVSVAVRGLLSSCGEWGLCRLLIAVLSLVAGHGLQERGLSGGRSRALEYRLSSHGVGA